MLRWIAPLAILVTGTAVTMLLMLSSSHADDKPPEHMAYLDAESGGLLFELQGEYLGRIGDEAIIGAQVVAGRDGKFDAVLYEKGLPGGGFFKTKVPLTGMLDKETVNFTGTNFVATLQKGVLKGTGDGAAFELHKIVRESPTLGAPPPPGAVVLFDGVSTVEWVNGKLVHDGPKDAAKKDSTDDEEDHSRNVLGVGTKTKQSFGSMLLHIEFRTPFMPTAQGQGRGNSGVYLADQYECQVLDSFGLSGENNECGGFYKLLKPKVNMCLPPLSWQTYDIDFEMAKFDAEGKKIRNAIVTLRHNGVIVHDHAELVSNTPGGGQNDESKPGPIMLQDHGNPVFFRNIWVVEKK